MKILKRAEFLELLRGAIFAKVRPWVFSSLSVKGETDRNDFTSLCLIDIDSHDTAQWVDRLEDMRDRAASYPMNEDFGREGCFDEGELFLVYEREDLLQLRAYIDGALESYK